MIRFDTALSLAIVLMAVVNLFIWPPGVNRAISAVMTVAAIVLATYLLWTMSA